MFRRRRPVEGQKLDPAKFPRQAALNWGLIQGGDKSAAPEPPVIEPHVPDYGVSPSRGGWHF